MAKISNAQRPPVAACNKCSDFSYVWTNKPCPRIVGGEPCHGRFVGHGLAEWEQCEPCDGIGLVGDAICAACRGYGWHLRQPDARLTR